MKRICNLGHARLTLCASLIAALTACGGGSGSSAANGGSPTPTTAGAQLTGKAIDGYLAGATVCFDNGAGTCDPSQPTTTTDANGNYSLPIKGDVTSKQIDVVVTSKTTDASNNNAAFPATFTLTAVVQGDTQNVTPLTSMVVAQMQTGLTQAQATTAVQGLVGSSVDPNADYVADGDSATTALAKQVVNTMLAFATTGALASSAGNNVLNAMVNNTTVTGVTQAEITTQANQPVYAIANASQVLANPTYNFVDCEISYYGGGTCLPVPTSPQDSGPIQNVTQIINNTLQTTPQINLPLGSSTWIDIQNYSNGAPDVGLTGFTGVAGQYELKADGTWTYVSEAQTQTALPLSTVGTTLAGTDPNTGLAFTYELRQIDLGGQPLSVVTPTTPLTVMVDWDQYPQITGTTFPSGTQAYLGLQSYSAGRVILPVYPEFCTNISGNCVAMNGVNTQVIGNPATTYTSVNQAVGLSLAGAFGGDSSGQLSSNGTAQISSYGGTVNATWSVYSANPNVILLNIAPTDIATLGLIWPIRNPLLEGAQLAVALNNGHLQFGLYYPSTYVTKSIQFPSGLPAVLTSALNAVLTAPQLPQ